MIMKTRLFILTLCVPLLVAGAEIGGGKLRNMARAWLLEPLTTDTINPSQNGMGWADDKFTIESPAGALQLYMQDDPEEATLYWPGRITAGTMEAASITVDLDASQITSGSIGPGIMMSSMTSPLAEYQDAEEYAGANGLTYTATGPASQKEPSTPGTYFAALEVTDGGAERNALVGRIRTAAQMGVPAIVSAPATASSTGTAGQIAYDASYFYVCTATNTWKRTALSTW